MWRDLLNLLFTTLIVFCVSCKSSQEVPSNFSQTEGSANQEGWNATLTTTQNGKIASKIKYTYMEMFSGQKMTKFTGGVEVNFYDSSGVHVSKVLADNAILRENTDTIELEGHVRVFSDDGVQLFTSKLHCNQKRNKVFSDQRVMVVTAERDTINGEGFESEKSLKNWVIRKPWGVTQKKLNLEIKESPSN